MTSPRLMFGALALSGAALLTGCTKPVVYEGISVDAFNAMQTQPVNSYSVVPSVRLDEPATKGGEPVRTTLNGKFDIIVKTGELNNPQAFDTKGTPGSMLCSTFKILSGTLDDSGRMNALYTYWRSGGRSGWYAYVNSPIDLSGKTAKVPETIDYDGCTATLVTSSYKTCKFTPATAH